jgi:hypothetical protein
MVRAFRNAGFEAVDGDRAEQIWNAVYRHSYLLPDDVIV